MNLVTSSKTYLLFVFGLAFILLAACTPETAPKPKAEAPRETKQPVAKADWEMKWDKLVEAAKKEGKVIVYTAGAEDTRIAFGEGFKKKFGIDSEWVGGRGPELSEKIMMERRAGLRVVDVLIGASQPAVVTLKPAGALVRLEPELVLPEVTNPKAWLFGEFPWLDKDHYTMSFLAYPDTSFVINMDYVKLEEVASFKDLLNPKWKGKLVMDDPTLPGSGASFFIAVKRIMGLDYLRELAKQEPFLTRDRRLMIEWAARGKYPIGIAPHTPFIPEFQRAGIPLEIGRPKEGTYVSQGIGILSLLEGAPHPTAARVFANWILTKEAQTAHAKATLQQSFRDDISVDYLPPLRKRDPNSKYFALVTEEYLLNYNDDLKKTQEIFGFLKK